MLQPKPKPLTEIYDLLAACGYPSLPDRDTAIMHLQGAAHITLCDGDKLVGWIGVHGNMDEVALDVAVLPAYRKRWATKELVRNVFGSIFIKGVERIKVVSAQPKVIKSANKLGFKMDDKNVSKCLHTNEIELYLTRKDFEGKYL